MKKCPWKLQLSSSKCHGEVATLVYFFFTKFASILMSASDVRKAEFELLNEMLCTIWYHLYNFKNVKNIHGGVLLLVKLQATACNFIKSNTTPWVFTRFLNWTNGTKSRNTSQMCGTWNNGLIQLGLIILSKKVLK